MKYPENIQEVAALAPDFMGFIFYKDSKRYIERLSPEDLSELPENIARVGVFVNQDVIAVVQIALQFKLDLIQLHGSEPVNYTAALKQQLKGSGVKFIKAFGLDEQFDFSILSQYEDTVDYFLFDTQTPDHGGSGKVFNWGLLENYTLELPYFLSGGIGLESMEALKQIDDKRLFAIDVNSKFETAPGKKDIDKLKEFKIKL
jgi:phosphoribosylanthranilate isomerase